MEENVSERSSITSNDSHLAVTKDECDEIIPSWDSWSKRGDFFRLVTVGKIPFCVV